MVDLKRSQRVSGRRRIDYTEYRRDADLSERVGASGEPAEVLHPVLRPDESWTHLRPHSLRDSAGKTVELPFLEIDEELWNPQMTRLTLFIDPGRIKRGVQPLEEIGPVLENGKHYALIIDAAWQDSSANR